MASETERKTTSNKIEDYNESIKINMNLISDTDDNNESYDELIEEGLKEINQVREEGKKKENKTKFRVNFLKNIFWWCAGADRDLLTMCPSDHSKYVGVGTTIAFTALMAFFSCLFAMQLVLKDYNPYIPFIVAAFWGAMIFSLDRFITNTMYSDGKVTISKEEFFGGLPRIVIAIILGIVISAPLELEIFKDTITMKIEEQRDAEHRKIVEETNTNTTTDYDKEKGKQDNLKADLNRDLKDIESSLKELGARPKEKRGRYDSTRKAYPILNQIEIDNWQKRYDELTTREQDIRAKIQTINGNLIELQSNNSLSQTEKQDELDDRFKNKFDDGLERRLSILHELAMEGYKSWNDGTKNDGFWDILLLHPLWYYLTSAQGLIMLLFILIDISPVLYKMMLADGVYDKYLQEEQRLANEKINIRQANILNHLDKSELKRVSPFVTDEMYQQMAGDYYVSKSEADFKKERENQHKITAIWRIFPFSMLRFLFWKEEDTPSAPRIEFNRIDDEMKKTLKDKNKEVFNYVLKLKSEIIKGAYRRWFKNNGGKDDGDNNTNNNNDGK